MGALDKSYLIFPASAIYALTQSNTTADPNGPFRGLLLTVAGDIKITFRNGSTVVITSGALAAGVIHPIRFTRVWTTGTTATGLFGVSEVV